VKGGVKRKSVSLSIMAVLALVAGTAICVPARAADEVGAARIGYVDIGSALNKVSDGQAAKRQLKLEFKEKQQRLNLMQKELEALRDELDRERIALSSEELESKERAYREKLTDVQRRFADFQRDMGEREARLTDEILKKIRQIVSNIGEEEGYALILERSQDVVLYSPNAGDLTERVIKEYNSGSGSKRGR